MVLAAGAGRRLAPYTDTLPKTLVPVDGDRTILDIALRTSRRPGSTTSPSSRATPPARSRSARPRSRSATASRSSSSPTTRPRIWNNAYSLWCARHLFAQGVLLVNGDTVHPPSVETTLLAARGPDILLALDDVKPLARGGDEGPRRRRGPDDADQQGARPGVGAGRVHRPDADRAGRGGRARRRAAGDLRARPAALLRGRLPGVRRPRRARRRRADRRRRLGEVDDHRDLARAREIACRC